MSLLEAQNAFVGDIARLIIFVQSSGWALSAGECWRPPEMQEIYLNQGKSRTLKSKHAERLAMDFNFFDMSSGKAVLTFEKNKLQFIGDYWESLDVKNKWGGNFKDKNGNSFLDTPHFERIV